MAALDNDEALLAELAVALIGDAPNRIDALNKALIDGDPQRVADAAHAIKGIAGHFHAVSTAGAAAELEKAARSGELPEQVDKMVDTVRASLEKLAHALGSRFS